MALGLFLSFGICHFTFSYFCRLESDDYTFLAYLRDKGFFGTIKFIYFSWEGAFGVLIISLLKIKFTLLFGSVFIHNVACTLSTFYFIFYFIRTVLSKYFFVYDSLYSLVLCILLYSNLYFNDLAINDTWYWLCGSVYFFMPALLLFFTAVLLKGSNKFLIVSAYLYFFLYGASRFNYSVILLSILGVIFLYSWFRLKKFNKTIFFLGLTVISSLIIYILAPGNYIRRSEELTRVLSAGEYVTGPLKMSFWFIYKYILLKFPFHVLFMFPALFIGVLLKNSLLKVLPGIKESVRVILCIIAFCLFCVYMQSLSMFVAKGSQRERTLEMLSIITSFCILTVFVIIGARLNLHKFIFAASIVCIIGASFFLLRRVQICYPLISKYSVAVDERHQTIRNALINFKGDTLKLKKLPPSSWLHTGELTKRNGGNPMNNIFLEEYYRPKFFLDIQN